MPRMTRAALRAQVPDEPHLNNQIHEDADADAHVLQAPETTLNTNQDQATRHALKDITYDNHPTSDDVFTDEPVVSSKKAKGKRTGKQQKQGVVDEELSYTSEVHADSIPENSHTTHSADSSFTIANNSNPEDSVLEEDTVGDQSNTEPIYVQPSSQELPPLKEPTSPPPQALTSAPKTPKFDPAVHTPESSNSTPATDTVEDSFIDKIKTRSPSKMKSYSGDTKAPDSFVEQISSRTPRIEDSVEEIDALEDAIEKISRGLPGLEGLNMKSPVKSTKSTPSRLDLPDNTKVTSTLRKSARTSARTPRLSPTKAAPPPQSATRSRSTRTNPSVARPTTNGPVVTKQQKKPIVDGSKPKDAALPQPPPLSFSSSPQKALPNTTKKRVPSTSLSTNKPGFIPSKSTKAPTKSTFSLPGEVISAKLKAQRDERLRREEEAEKAKKNFKARPMPIKASEPSVKPRENKASQARLSIYAGGVNKENIEPQLKVAERKVRPMSMVSAKPKLDATKANSGIRRTTSVIERSTTTKTRVSSIQLTAGQKSAVSKEDAVQQKAKGKEVFGRTKVETERNEKERKEKEEAARKARAEAAERGRQASREWAEKQKKRLALQTAAKAGGNSASASSAAASVTS